ncbi:MAG: class I SAM-dependent methyltransferase [Chthoniobacterales bacterium]
MSRRAARAVRDSYERLPYPKLSRAELRRPPWRLAPLDWIEAVGQPAVWPPRRILVAGCGTGLEAFALRRRFPRAEIVGIDFSAQSIRRARQLQRQVKGGRDLRFLRADLLDAGLTKRTGGEFDMISCHGVMSYVPELGRALRHLAACLAGRGVLCLGVNGREHFSRRWRPFLSAFGLEVDRWKGGREVTQTLGLAEALSAAEGEVVKHGPTYLSSDLFVPIMHHLPLGRWLRIARQAGLHLRGSYETERSLRPAINRDLCDSFLPRSRGQVAEVIDTLLPGAFYRFLFTREPETVPPWDDLSALLRWRPVRTNYFGRIKWPARRGAPLRLQNRQANLSVEIRGQDWEIELLRASDGARAVRDIVSGFAPATIRQQLYRFYLLDLLNFRGP